MRYGPIRSLLVANRGEIARRIQRSARALGMRCVAVYADGDRDAPFVREADIAIALNGKSSAETYLDIAKILAAAKRTGADAVHPGYGFLSENARFAKAVIDADLNWVGPPPEAIAAMGDKLASKKLIEKAKVPTLPAAELRAKDDVRAAAKRIGFPILVKAAAGGGGKGMRIVEKEAELSAAIEGARREAGSAFGDDRIFLERYLRGARHVEIQVLGDKHGNLIHCFERECSIQRRHQKVIEEAPSPAVDAALRERMGAAALAAARAVNYYSAGTVEFLLDEEEFFFLEMNTRLQVEHPVTEAILGLDLVREQLLIAQGEKLSLRQDQLTANGHAIEVRLYAEDPEKDFLPATGTVLKWQPARDGIRYDSGIETGSVIGIEFDPMLAKVIVHAPTRLEAALRLAKALEDTRVQGLRNNRDFLVALLRDPDFLAGETSTNFIEQNAISRARVLEGDDLRDAAILIALAGQAARRAQAKLWPGLPAGWRNTPMPPQNTKLSYREREIVVNYVPERDGSFRVTMEGKTVSASVLDASADNIVAAIDGVRIGADLARDGERWFIGLNGGDFEFTEIPRFPARTAAAVKGALVAPMPAKVTAVMVAQGAHVTRGQVLMILEAMKMEHRIAAPAAGVVTELRVKAGDQVANNALLAIIGDEGEGT